MTRSRKRRMQTRIARQTKPEQEAFSRVQARRFGIDRVYLSDAVAIRRMQSISPLARRLVWGMVAHLSINDTTRAELMDAAVAFGFKSILWQTIDELHAAGLMTSKPNGNLVLHPFFTGLGHAVRRRSEGATDDGDRALGHVTRLSKEFA